MPDSTLDARIESAMDEADRKERGPLNISDTPRELILTHNIPWLTAFATALDASAEKGVDPEFKVQYERAVADLASERSARAEVESEHQALRDGMAKVAEAIGLAPLIIIAKANVGETAIDFVVRRLTEKLATLTAAERERYEARRIVEAVAEAAGFAKTFDPSLIAGKVTALRSQVASAKNEGREWFKKGWNRFAEVAVSREVIKAPCPQLEHPPYVWRICGIEPDAEFDRLYPDAPATPPERVSGDDVVVETDGGFPPAIRITPEIAKRIVALAGGAE